MSGFFSEMFSPKHLGSGGLTFINDGLLKATGMGNNTTLGALNDAAEHGPMEESLTKGRPVTYTEAVNERGNRLGQDGSGNAKTVANIAGLIGMMFGGAAAGGAMGGSGAGASAGTGASTAVGTGATTGATTGAAGAGYSGAASNAAFDSAMAGSSAGTGAAGTYGGTGAASDASFNAALANSGASTSGGGLLSYVKPMGEAASSANQVKGLLGANGQPVQSHAPDQGNGQGAQTLAQLYQQGLQPQAAAQRRTIWS